MKTEVHIALEVHDGQYVLTRRHVIDGREHSCEITHTAIAVGKDDVFVGCPKLHVNPADDDDYPGPTNPLTILEQRVAYLESRAETVSQDLAVHARRLRELEQRTVGLISC